MTDETVPKELIERLSVIREHLEILRDSAKKDATREMASGFMNAEWVGYWMGRQHAFDVAFLMIDSLCDEWDD